MSFNDELYCAFTVGGVMPHSVRSTGLAILPQVTVGIRRAAR